MERVFVYGSLKRHEPNHFLLSSSGFAGVAITCESKYRMGNVGSYPEITRTDCEQAGFIEGELFECDSSTLIQLDELESNGTAYQREQIPIRLIDATNEKVVMAWTYFWLLPPCPVQVPLKFMDGFPVYVWRTHR